MKIRLGFSNDGIGAAVAIGNLADSSELQDKASETIRKFVKWNGSHGDVTVDFDIESGTATVIPVG